MCRLLVSLDSVGLCSVLATTGGVRSRFASLFALAISRLPASTNCVESLLLCRLLVSLGSVGLCSVLATTGGVRSRFASSFALAISRRPASTVCSGRSCAASSSALALSVSAPPWRPALDFESPPHSPWLCRSLLRPGDRRLISSRLLIRLGCRSSSRFDCVHSLLCRLLIGLDSVGL